MVCSLAAIPIATGYEVRTQPEPTLCEGISWLVWRGRISRCFWAKRPKAVMGKPAKLEPIDLNRDASDANIVRVFQRVSILAEGHLLGARLAGTRKENTADNSGK